MQCKTIINTKEQMLLPAKKKVLRNQKMRKYTKIMNHTKKKIYNLTQLKKNHHRHRHHHRRHHHHHHRHRHRHHHLLHPNQRQHPVYPDTQ